MCSRWIYGLSFWTICLLILSFIRLFSDDSSLCVKFSNIGDVCFLFGQLVLIHKLWYTKDSVGFSYFSQLLTLLFLFAYSQYIFSAPKYFLVTFMTQLFFQFAICFMMLGRKNPEESKVFLRGMRTCCLSTCSVSVVSFFLLPQKEFFHTFGVLALLAGMVLQIVHTEKVNQFPSLKKMEFLYVASYFFPLSLQSGTRGICYLQRISTVTTHEILPFTIALTYHALVLAYFVHLSQQNKKVKETRYNKLEFIDFDEDEDEEIELGDSESRDGL